jgi:hypothetical protein
MGSLVGLQQRCIFKTHEVTKEKVMGKAKVTEQVYNKVHELKSKFGKDLTQSDLAFLVNKHQTTIGRILTNGTYEEYKNYKKARNANKVQDFQPEVSNDVSTEPTKDVGSDLIAEVRRVGDTLESIHGVLQELLEEIR